MHHVMTAACYRRKRAEQPFRSCFKTQQQREQSMTRRKHQDKPFLSLDHVQQLPFHIAPPSGSGLRQVPLLTGC